MITLRVNITPKNEIQSLDFQPTATIGEVLNDIKGKAGCEGDDYGLFQPGSKPPRWLVSTMKIEDYEIEDGDQIDFKRKTRVLRVKMLDDSNLTININDIITVDAVVEAIARKMGLKNPEEYSLKNGPGAEWLNPAQSLSEQGVKDSDELLLQKKYFINDANVSKHDLVNLHMLYIQLRHGVVAGEYPCTAEEAIKLASVQCQVALGDHLPSAHTPGSIKIKSYLPKFALKQDKNAEKKMWEAHKDWTGLTETAAKYKYVQLCRGLKTYGTTFFNVKEVSKATKKSVERILGVNKDSINLYLPENREVDKEFPLTHLLRWAATPNTLTLDFGDYQMEYINFVTPESEVISKLIGGYIEIMAKKRKGLLDSQLELDREREEAKNFKPAKSFIGSTEGQDAEARPKLRASVGFKRAATVTMSVQRMIDMAKMDEEKKRIAAIQAQRLAETEAAIAAQYAAKEAELSKKSALKDEEAAQLREEAQRLKTEQEKEKELSKEKEKAMQEKEKEQAVIKLVSGTQATKEMELRMKELELELQKSEMRSKQLELQMMEEKLKAKKAQLATAAPARPRDSQGPAALAALYGGLFGKLEKLDRLDELLRKLDTMKMAAAAGGASADGSNQYDALKGELEELQKIIIDENNEYTQQEKEDANIKFEKAFQALQQTTEFKMEAQRQIDEKRAINEPLNREALARLAPIYTPENIKATPELHEKVMKAPELTLIGMDPKVILSKHQNDFKQYLLRDLELDELRAIRASLPKFRNDQKKQQEWCDTLEDKIDNYVAPVKKEHVKPAKVWKPKVAEGASSLGKDMFSELLDRRKREEGSDGEDEKEKEKVPEEKKTHVSAARPKPPRASKLNVSKVPPPAAPTPPPVAPESPSITPDAPTPPPAPATPEPVPASSE